MNVPLTLVKNTDSASKLGSVALPGGTEIPLDNLAPSIVQQILDAADAASGTKIAPEPLDIMKANDSLTKRHHNDGIIEDGMNSNFYNSHTLFWTIIGAACGIIAVVIAMLSMSIQTTQAIRDEMKAENGATLVEIKSQVEIMHNEISDLKTEFNHASEIQDLKTENTVLKERQNGNTAH